MNTIEENETETISNPDISRVAVHPPVMQFFLLTQRDYFDFTSPDAVNHALVRASSETEARDLATKSEHKHRCGAQYWDSAHATCKVLTYGCKPGVILFA